MTAMSAEELAQDRATATDYLDDQATIYRLTTTTDQAGGKVSSWAAVGTPVGAATAPPTARDRAEFGEALRGPTSTVCRLPWDTDIREGDRLLMASGYAHVVTAVGRKYTWGIVERCSINRLPHGVTDG